MRGLSKLALICFGFGGWPLDENSNLIIEILELVRSLVPPEFPIHALGIGHQSIVTAYNIGYEMFDSALPPAMLAMGDTGKME